MGVEMVTFNQDKEDNSQFFQQDSKELVNKLRMKQLEHGLKRVAKEVDKRILENKW